MNYLTEIIAFEQWLENNYLPISQQLLWYKLMWICNRSGWSEWVTVDNLRLMAAMQMSREATLITARDGLLKAGLLQYQKGKKGSPNKYKMMPFEQYTFKTVVQSEVETVVQSEVKSGVETAVETADIYKQKQNKKKDTNVSKEKGDVRHRRGEYSHVLLSDNEISRLESDYGRADTDAAIKFLDEYIQRKGYTHKDSNLTIRKWVIAAVREKDTNTGTVGRNKNRFHNFDQSDTDYDAIVWEQIRGDQ